MAKNQYQKPQPTDANAAPAQEQVEQTEQTNVEQQQPTDKVEGAESGDQTQSTQEGSGEEDSSDEQPTQEDQSGDKTEQQSTEPAAETGETKPAESTEPAPTVIEPATGAEQTQTIPVSEPAPIEQQTPAPVAQEPAPIAPAVVEPAPVELTESATERFASEPAQVSTLRQELQNYIGDMAPNRRIDPQEGAAMQTALARLIDSTVTEPDSRVFIAKMSVWMETIRTHRNGVFNERYVNRFADSIALSKSKLQSFQYLVHLFLTTADGTPVNASIQMETALRGVGDDYSARLRQYVERVTKR